MQAELSQVVLESAQVDDQPVEPSQLHATFPGGILTGRCRLTLKSGCTYDGDLVDGRLHGQGRLVFPDGLIYHGGFDNNTIHGRGIYRWPGGAVYEGQVQAGLRHGTGRMTFADSPVVYQGAWHQGKRHGHGKIVFNREQTHWYEGSWEDDKKCGQGTMQYSNGDQYVGAWKDDVKCGWGTMHWASKKQTYEGYWSANLPNGTGTHTWHQQLVTEPSPSNHALLLLFNRYEGHFVDGARAGYGVLHYATGARFEGCWQADMKQGPGLYVFENGEVWQGDFKDDQPILSEGEVFAPKNTGVCLQVHDLVSEEEVAGAAERGLANLLMAHNTDLRSLYDKYCKRPSLHLKTRSKPCFTMVSCQVWELLGDVRLITATTPLARCNELLALARRPPAALAAFRASMQEKMCCHSDSNDVAWWDGLISEDVYGSIHNPMQELLFKEFCEFLVRLAAVRYRHLPALEKRFQTLINVHLIHQVSKNKATLPPPPRTPFHLQMWAGNATSVLHSSDATLRRGWAATSDNSSSASAQGTMDGCLQPSTSEQEPSRDEQAATTEQPLLSDSQLYSQVKTVRSALQLLQRLGLLGSSATALQAATAMTFNYLTVNTYSLEPQRLRVETEVAPAADTLQASPRGKAEPSSAQGSTEAHDADTCEVLCWLDQPMIYADWVEGIARVAQATLGTSSDGAGLTADVSTLQQDRPNSSGSDTVVGMGTSTASDGKLHQQLQTFLAEFEKSLNNAQ